MSYAITPPLAIVEPEADSQRRIVRSHDPGLLTKRTTDFCLDAQTAIGHASGALPAGGANVGAGGLVNLANDNPPALPAQVTGAVTAVPANGNVAFSAAAGARGLSFAGGYAGALAVGKAGQPSAAVGCPPAEGFLDFMVLCWLKPSALTYWSAFGCNSVAYLQPTGKFWGLACNAGGSVGETLSQRAVPGLFAGEWAQVGLHYAFVGDAIFMRQFVNGVETQPALGAQPITTTRAQLAAAPRNAAVCFVGYDNINPGFQGVIARFERVFTGIAGMRIDPAFLAAADMASNRARITA